MCAQYKFPKIGFPDMVQFLIPETLDNMDCVESFVIIISCTNRNISTHRHPLYKFGCNFSHAIFLYLMFWNIHIL